MAAVSVRDNLSLPSPSCMRTVQYQVDFHLPALANLYKVHSSLSLSFEAVASYFVLRSF